MDTAYLESHVRLMRTGLHDIEEGRIANGVALLRETTDRLAALLAAERRPAAAPINAGQGDHP